MKTRKLNDKNKKKLKNYNIHIGRKVGDRKQTYKDPEEDQSREGETQESQENVLVQNILCLLSFKGVIDFKTIIRKFLSRDCAYA